jgi:hypothetical protein
LDQANNTAEVNWPIPYILDTSIEKPPKTGYPNIVMSAIRPGFANKSISKEFTHEQQVAFHLRKLLAAN